MPHATHKARRILTSAVPHAPVAPRRSRFERQALLVVSVGFTMIVIVGLYAATFRARMETSISSVDAPRWSLLDDDLLRRALPVKDQLASVKKTLSNLAGAGQTQAKAAVILKAKIEARAASGTPETSPTPETPETP
ncbi:MAG TPA: hypothetical protein VJ694_04645 [Patescibacteria group bacterium]|nr:hypothetical protein [Patescibacteria group bacterium]